MGVWTEEKAFSDELEALCIAYLWRLAGKASKLGLDAFQASEQKLSLSVEDAKF